MSSALRPLTQEDLRAVHELLADPAVVRYMLIPLSASIEDSQQFLTAGLNENQPVPQCWRSIMRAIVRGSTVVGLCGIVVQIGSEEGEIWYLVDPRRQCRGIATQAVLQLLAFAFETLGLHRVFACCVPDNAASAKVLRKV